MESAWTMEGARDEGPGLEARLVAELPRLAHYVRRLLGAGAARGDVDDVLQEVAARAWKYRGAFEDGRALAPWLRATALRVVIDALARRGRAGNASVADVELLASNVAQAQPLDSREQVERMCAPLSQIERDVLMRFHGRGESVGEIATALATPAGTVKSLLHRARRKLIERARPEDSR